MSQKAVNLALANKLKVYNNVDLMKADRTLRSGMTAMTLGYHEPNDGGGGTYIIREKTPEDVDDGGSIHDITGPGLVGELVIEKYVTPEQFGAYGDGGHDDSSALQKIINNGKGKIIFFKGDKYLIRSTLIIDSEDNHEGFTYNGVTLQLNPASRLVTDVNIPIIKIIGPGNTIKGGIIDVSKCNNYTNSAVILSSEKRPVTSNIFRDIKIFQGNRIWKGNAFLLDCSEYWMYRNIFENIEINWFACGFNMQCPSKNKIAGGVNANSFKTTFWSVRQPAIIYGGGNIFEFIGQCAPLDSTNPELACFEVYGSRNNFSGHIYDVDNAGRQVKYLFEFGENGSRNIIECAPSDSQIKNEFNNWNYILGPQENSTKLLLDRDVNMKDSLIGAHTPYHYYYRLDDTTNILSRQEYIESIDCIRNNIDFYGMDPELHKKLLHRVFRRNHSNINHTNILGFVASDSNKPAKFILKINFKETPGSFFKIGSAGVCIGLNSVLSEGANNKFIHMKIYSIDRDENIYIYLKNLEEI